MFSNTRLSLNATLLALFVFIVLVVGLSQLSSASLEGLAVGSSSSSVSAGGSAPLVLVDTILLGNNSIINFSNSIYGNVGPNASYSFTLGILYNCNGSDVVCGVVQLNHYKGDGSIVNLISLAAQNGTQLTEAGMAAPVLLATGEYVQLIFGAGFGDSLQILPGSSYSIIRISQ